MAFTDGLDYWELAGGFSDDGQQAGQDYSCAAADQSAVLAATVPEPAGSAVLVQAIDADDYRGRTLTFRGELRTAQAASPDPREHPAGHIASATGTGAWTQYEVTAQIPAHANLIRFGVFLNGGGQLEFRHPALAPHPPGQQ